MMRLAVGACALSTVAAVNGPARQRFAIGERGSLVFDVPADWRVSTVPLSKPPSITLTVRPAAGDAFVLKVTSVWMDAAGGQRLTSDRMKESVRLAANDALPMAVEKDAPLIELRGKDTAGYYFSVTDKQSSNSGGDYKYMSQGTAVTGPVMTAFTFLSHSGIAADRDRALRLVASATWSDTPPADVSTAQSAVQIEELPQAPYVRVRHLGNRDALKVLETFRVEQKE
jgi:hypothetical protein